MAMPLPGKAGLNGLLKKSKSKKRKHRTRK